MYTKTMEEDISTPAEPTLQAPSLPNPTIPTPSPRRFTPKWLIFLLLIICLSLYYVLNIKTFIDRSSRLQEKIATPTHLPKADRSLAKNPLSNWKTYTNEKNGFSFSYPNDWQYIDDELKPQSGYLHISNTKTTNMYAPTPLANAPESLKLVIGIERTEKTPEEIENDIKNGEYLKDYHVSTIDNKKAYRYSTIYNTQVTEGVMLINHDTLYTISLNHDDANPHADIFDHVLSTFTLTK